MWGGPPDVVGHAVSDDVDSQRSRDLGCPVLEIEFGPPHTNFGSVWSSQKARKFRQIQPTTKVRILCFEWKRICFQTRDVLCSYNMNYEE